MVGKFILLGLIVLLAVIEHIIGYHNGYEAGRAGKEKWE